MKVRLFYRMHWHGRVALRLAILCGHLRLLSLAQKLILFACSTVRFSKEPKP